MCVAHDDCADVVTPGFPSQMIKFGIPAEAAQNKMRVEGLDPAVLGCDPTKPLPKKFAPKENEGDRYTTGPPLKEDPRFSKYFTVCRSVIADMVCFDGLSSCYAHRVGGLGLHVQMLRILKNKGAVEHKMTADGVDPAIIDEDPGESCAVCIGRVPRLKAPPFLQFRTLAFRIRPCLHHGGACREAAACEVHGGVQGEEQGCRGDGSSRRRCCRWCGCAGPRGGCEAEAGVGAAGQARSRAA
jgi:hypothetical protein